MAKLPRARQGRVGWAGRAGAGRAPGCGRILPGWAGMLALGKGLSSPGNKSSERCLPAEASKLCFLSLRGSSTNPAVRKLSLAPQRGAALAGVL